MSGMLRPFAGIAYDHVGSKLDFGLSLSAAYRMVLTHSYKIRIIQKEQLDYQLAYLPYAYRNREGVEVRSSLYVSIPMRNTDRLMAELRLYGDLMKRKDGIAYGKTPGVISHILSDPQAERTSGHTIGATCNIFYLF